LFNNPDLKAILPMRPKPLIPTLIDILSSYVILRLVSKIE
jgi:hypothetical protein